MPRRFENRISTRVLECSLAALVIVSIALLNGCAGLVGASSTGSLSISTASLASGTVGAPYSQSLQASGGTAPYAWSVSSGSLPAGLALDSSSGLVSGTPTAAGTSSFTVQVTDASKSTAHKGWGLAIGSSLSITTLSLANGTVGGAYSATLQAKGGNSPYTWSTSSGSLPAGLALNTSTGVISGTPTASGTSSFTAKVTDTSNNTATQSLSMAVTSALSISTATLTGGTVGTAYSATLQATGGATPYSWTVSSGSLPAGLTLNASTGAISGTPTASGTSTFTAKVTDANSSTATKSLSISVAQALSIPTSALAGGTVGTAYSATLQATGGATPYSWSVSSGSLPAGLTLSASTGAISGTPTASGTSSFTVKVTDANSNTTTKSLSIAVAAATPTLSISTSSLSGGTVGTAYSATLQASGGTTPYSWSVSSGSLPAGLTLNASTGAISGTPTASGTSSFTVKVTDANSNTATKSLSIAVAAATPTLSISTSTLTGGTVGTSYSATLQASGGTTPYSWSVSSGSLPAGLTLNASIGAISGTPTASGTSSFTVKVTDANSNTATKSLSIAVAQALSIPTSALAGGTVGTAYSATLQASGGTTPYSWSVSSGSLPAGLALNASTGAISGTPTASGTSSFTVKVTDANSNTATKSLSIAVAAATPTLSISTSSVAGGTVGTAYSATLQASGGTTPYSWSVSSGSLPAGLTLNASTGAISGTPTASGTSSFTVKVTDANSNTATKSLSISVAQALSIPTSALAGGTVGTSYSATLQASGGTTPYSWSVSSGSLPAGLTLNASTGAISGTPTASGTSSFTVKVTDANSNTATKSLSIAVAAATPTLSISTSSLAGGTVGTAYSATLQATGGTTPYTWGVSGLSLPAGLSLNSSTGVISGTPTASGTFSFTVQVTDAKSNTATKALSITVAANTSQSVTITTTTLPNGILNQAYSATLQATGGTAPYTWTIISGQLPTGLALSSTGQISGTATATGQSNFTAQAKDSSSTAQTATASLAISIGTVSLDQYGGRTDIKCANATGWFHTEEINSHWWFCTPLGNAFYSMGVTYTPGYIHGKFGPTDVNRRLQSWGFDTLQVGAHKYELPIAADCSEFPTDSNGVCSQPVKMPFIVSVNAAYYAMSNPVISGPNAPLLTNPVKNMMSVRSSSYTGFVPGVGIADYYDSGVGTWLQKDIAGDTGAAWSWMKSSIYANYALGIASDDSDEMAGFGAGPDFATVPAGQNTINLGMFVATISPVETANTNVAGRSGSNFVYTDTLMHSKLALRNMLAGEYSSVSALNSAWGSNYTTFDSSGTCVGTQPITCASSAAADTVGTGNGSALTFSATLSHATVSKFSLQILVGGTPVAGDLGNGTLYGPNVSSGSITYSTGVLSLTFTSGHAPASGAAITATYVANGWGIGTGFLDEDNRSSHNAWLGTDWIWMKNANATTKADVNTFLEQIAAQYFSAMRTQIKAAFPNVMYLGPNTLGTWDGPPSAPVLKAAAQYIDAFIAGGGTSLYTQAEMDYIEQNYGNKPYFNAWYSSANADSAVGGTYTGTAGDYATQSARALAYYTAMTAMLQTSHTTAGDYPYVGVYWWEYADQPSQKYADGLVTPSDNAYDSYEAAATAVLCSTPIATYTCGSEPAPGGTAIRPFGNLIGGATGVAAANALWLAVP